MDGKFAVERALLIRMASFTRHSDTVLPGESQMIQTAAIARCLELIAER